MTRKNGQQLVAELEPRYGRNYKLHDCFHFKVIKDNGKVKPQFRKIYPRRITKAQLERIRRKVERDMAGIDWDNI